MELCKHGQVATLAKITTEKWSICQDCGLRFRKSATGKKIESTDPQGINNKIPELDIVALKRLRWA